MVEEPPSEVDKTLGVGTIDWQSWTESLEPEHVEGFCHVSSPFVVVHFCQVLVLYQLAHDLLFQKLICVIIVRDLSWSAEELLVKLWKHFVAPGCFAIESFFIDRNGLNWFLFQKRMYQSRVHSRPFLAQKFLEVHDLSISISSS